MLKLHFESGQELDIIGDLRGFMDDRRQWRSRKDMWSLEVGDGGSLAINMDNVDYVEVVK